MRKGVVLYQTFPARIDAVEALVVGVDSRASNATQLRGAADSLDLAGPIYGRASTAATYAAFAELLRIVAMLVEWRYAVLNADVDPERFLRASKERYRLWLGEHGSKAAQLALVSNGIESMTSIDQVGSLCNSLARTPLPIGIFATEPSIISGSRRKGSTEGRVKVEPPELAVAFLRFAINGVPANETHFLPPGESHDLEIDIRISRWPEGAESLELMPVSIEPKSNYDLPVFKFSAPSGEPPFRFGQRGRAVLKVPQNLHARPFEFKYAASFSPESVEQPIAVVGQRTLRIEGIDLTRAPITGYLHIDQKILQLRDDLRSRPLISAADLDSTLKVLVPLCSLAGRAVQDALFKGTPGEPQFQTRVRDELRRDPAIASQLEEHPHAAGGITDLSFRGIRIELKYEPDSALTLKDCGKFADQTISYVVATGKRVGVLCVLDNSEKKAPPFPAEEGIDLLIRTTKEASICIVTVLLQGNLARPSDLSR